MMFLLYSIIITLFEEVTKFNDKPLLLPYAPYATFTLPYTTINILPTAATISCQPQFEDEEPIILGLLYPPCSRVAQAAGRNSPSTKRRYRPRGNLRL